MCSLKGLREVSNNSLVRMQRAAPHSSTLAQRSIRLLTKEKFERLLETIDSEFGETDINFHQRPLHAFTKLAQKVDPKGTFVMRSDIEVSKDDFTNDALCAQVHKWYEKRYGDRIKIHMGPGSYILMIKNEPWEVVYPLCFGQNNFTIDSDLFKKNRRYITASGQVIPSVNILCHVKDMTFDVANSLNDYEKQTILSEYMFGLNALQSLRSLSGAPFMEQAANDYDISVSNIFHKYPDYNNSKWAALQFAEKTMKSQLQTNNIAFKYNHNLAELAESLKAIGLNVPMQIISNIHCKAAVRYGEQKVTRNQAILAVQSALALFADVFKASECSYES